MGRQLIIMLIQDTVGSKLCEACSFYDHHYSLQSMFIKHDPLPLTTENLDLANFTFGAKFFPFFFKIII